MSDSNTPRPDSSPGDPADETAKIDPHAGDPSQPGTTGEPTSTGQGDEWRGHRQPEDPHAQS